MCWHYWEELRKVPDAPFQPYEKLVLAAPKEPYICLKCGKVKYFLHPPVNLI